MQASLTSLAAPLAATQLLNTVWRGRGFPVDPAWIASALGVTVLDTELPYEVIGGLVKDADKQAVLLLNQADSALDKRLCCAHTIGHFTEHHAQQDAFYKYIELRDQSVPAHAIERDAFARQFSAELLMPAAELRRLQAQGASTAAMAEHFGVAESVMSERIVSSEH